MCHEKPRFMINMVCFIQRINLLVIFKGKFVHPHLYVMHCRLFTSSAYMNYYKRDSAFWRSQMSCKSTMLFFMKFFVFFTETTQ